MKIVRRREIIKSTYFTRYFARVSCPSSGFSFPCDADGNVDESGLQPAGRRSLKACLAGEVDGEPMVDRGVEENQHAYTEPTIGLCGCGEEVMLEGFTNTCERCGVDYNHAGQRLASRSQWGEETGETAADILGPEGSDW